MYLYKREICLILLSNTKNLHILRQIGKNGKKRAFPTAGVEPGHLLQTSELLRSTICASSQNQL